MKNLENYLGNIGNLVETSVKNKKEFHHPKSNNSGVLTIVLIREIISPTVFRQQDPEILSIEYKGIDRIRGIANKFKYKERQKGLQILRMFGVGGKQLQNRTYISEEIKKSKKYGEVFDLNSLVFGDSTNKEETLQLKAGFLYSDALSIQEYSDSVDSTFQNRAEENGCTYDLAEKVNSSALHSQHFIKPGTIMVQTITTQGKNMTPEMLDHLLLSIGVSNSYGGRTSVSGLNIKTHIAGIFGGKVEKPVSSPYVLVDGIDENSDIEEVIRNIEDKMSSSYNMVSSHSESTEYLSSLIEKLENDDETLEKQYKNTKEKIDGLFEAWFKS